MCVILIGLGSNRSHFGQSSSIIVARAFAALCALGEGGQLSPLYRSEAWPDPTAPAYINAVARVQTALAPAAVLAGLQAIEAGFGRVRYTDPEQRYAPRTLDLDLLDYEGVVMEGAHLTLPHPGIAERDFVVMPLGDVAPDWVHPVSGLGVRDLLARLPKGSAQRLDADLP